MFGELLLNSDESIFLQAVDEYFYNINLISNLLTPVNNNSSEQNDNNKNSFEHTQDYLEEMNTKFYESLYDYDTDNKDLSTVEDSDNSMNSDVNYKDIICIQDAIIVDKNRILKLKENLVKYYVNILSKENDK